MSSPSPKGVAGGFVDSLASRTRTIPRRRSRCSREAGVPERLQRQLQGARTAATSRTSRSPRRSPASSRRSGSRPSSRRSSGAPTSRASSVASTSCSCSARAASRSAPPPRPTGAARSRASPGRGTRTRRSTSSSTRPRRRSMRRSAPGRLRGDVEDGLGRLAVDLPVPPAGHLRRGLARQGLQADV